MPSELESQDKADGAGGDQVDRPRLPSEANHFPREEKQRERTGEIGGMPGRGETRTHRNRRTSRRGQPGERQMLAQGSRGPTAEEQAQDRATQPPVPGGIQERLGPAGVGGARVGAAGAVSGRKGGGT